MLKKSLVAACAITLGTFSLTACGSSGSGGSGDSGDDSITMGFAQVGAESGWRTANTKSIKESAKAEGVDLKFSDAQQKQENQIKAIRSYIQQKVDVIAFSPVVETGWDTVLVEAKRANIPVILTDRSVDSEDDSLYETFLGSDFVLEGEKAGKWLVDNAGEADGNGDGKINVVQLEGTTGAAPAIDRGEGFASEIKSDPKIEVVASQTGDFTRDGGKKVMESFLKSQKGIDVVFAHNDDMGLGAIEAIKAAGQKPGTDIKIITVDAVKDGMTALSKGEINFIVECNPLLGPQLMDLADKVVAGEEVPKRVVTKETTFTQEQATEVLAEREVLTRTTRVEGSLGSPGDGGVPSEPTSQWHQERGASDDPDGRPAGREGRAGPRPRRADEHGVPPIVEMHDIHIAFGGVPALSGVDLRLFPGEVHALMGENGAGKSTMIKALTGVYSIDAGSIKVGGADQIFSSPAASQAAGISTVYQEINLCTNLTVAENMMLGREPRRFGGINRKAMNLQAEKTLDRLGLKIDPASQLGQHPIAVQQLVAIARAVDVDCKVLILDEPTSSLDSDEVAKLFEVMRTLREQGVAIVFVSHFLDQIFEISDRLTVLRNGALVGEHMTKDVSELELVRMMIGRELEALERIDREIATTEVQETGTPVLKALRLGRKGSLEAVDLDVFEGEVIGVAGLLGSGRTELARLLFGADTADTGELEVRAKSRRFRSPRHAIDSKIAFSSENRRAEGVIEDLTVADNMLLALQATRGWLRPIPQATRASWRGSTSRLSTYARPTRTQ